mgnify:CR=1 FL=1
MTKEVALALLGLDSNNLTEEAINEAYRAAVQLNHPDRFVMNERLRHHAEEQCILINEARSVLLNQTWTDRTNFAARQPDQGCSSNANPSMSNISQDEDEDRASHKSFSPLLDVWRTSAAMSVLGIVAFIIVFNLESIVPFGMMFFASLVRMIFMIVQFLYALVVYPSYFGLKPKIRSCEAISFWNCAIGGMIFGPIWNSNLTNCNKGISYIVYAVLVGALSILWLLSFGYLFAMMGLY